jgi:DNA polymerase III subunit beta
MKIIVDREQLASAFALAGSVAPSRSPKEILQNVKLTAVGGKITLEATDMEISIRAQVGGEFNIQQEGTVLLPVGRTAAILRESTDEDMVIELVDVTIFIKGKTAKFRLPSANPDEFPQVPQFGSADFLIVEARALKTAIQRTVYATDSESSRFALGGIKLEMDGDRQAVAVGTDGRRLTYCHFAVEKVGVCEYFDPSKATILPSVAAKLLERSIEPKDGPVKIAARTNDVIVESDRCTIFTRLIEGRYPNWRQVIAGISDDHARIDVPNGCLRACIRQAAITTSMETRGVVMTFDAGSMVIESETAELGQSRIETPIAYDEDRKTVKVDYRFVAEFCNVIQPDEILGLRVASENRPIELASGDDYKCVIMPMARDR